MGGLSALCERSALQVAQFSCVEASPPVGWRKRGIPFLFYIPVTALRWDRLDKTSGVIQKPHAANDNVEAVSAYVGRSSRLILVEARGINSHSREPGLSCPDPRPQQASLPPFIVPSGTPVW